MEYCQDCSIELLSRSAADLDCYLMIHVLCSGRLSSLPPQILEKIDELRNEYDVMTNAGMSGNATILTKFLGLHSHYQISQSKPMQFELNAYTIYYCTDSVRMSWYYLRQSCSSGDTSSCLTVYSGGLSLIQNRPFCL